MKLQEKGAFGLSWIEFELFSPFPSLRHAVFSRKGGKSLPPFDSLNISNNQGDDPSHVEENRARIHHLFPDTRLVGMNQVHGKTILRVDSSSSFLPPCDGLMTNCKRVALMGAHADCQMAIFYDPIQEAVALVHAGWRGQKQEIYRECIEKMEREFGSQPREIRVAISPSLGPLHAEFIHYEQELPTSWHPFRSNENHFDLWQVAAWQLENAGILPSHIQLAQVCTYANCESYYSFRREKKTGRNATVVSLQGAS